MAQVIGVPAEFRDSAYRRRRGQNWILVGLLYSFFYMTRYSFSALAPDLKEFFAWDEKDLGLFETIMPLFYGFSVVINAPIADRIGGKKAFLLGAAGVVVMNALFGCTFLLRDPSSPTGYALGLTASSTAWVMSLMWGVNAYFQSFGALSIVKINAQWFHLKERGRFGAIFGVLIRLGLILAFSGVPFIASLTGNWMYGFWIPACFVAILFVLVHKFVVDNPSEAGYADLDTGDAVVAETNGKVRIRDVLKKVFTSRTMWMIAVASMMIGLIRRSILDSSWFPLYFKQNYDIGKDSAWYHVTSWGIAILGIAGGFLFGWLSDQVYHGRRAPAVVFGFIGMLVMLGFFWFSDYLGLGKVGAVTSFVMLSFFVNGAHGMIGGAASMDFGGKKAAATAAGLFDGMQYFAGAFTGTIVGIIIKDLGDWQLWKLWVMPAAVVGAVVMATLWNTTPRGNSSH